MLKNVLIFSLALILVLLLSKEINAQGVAINTDGTDADGSSMLDVKSTSAGMLIPRMTIAQRNAIGTPATSLLIYQTDSDPGYYYYDGSAWVRLSVGEEVDPTWDGDANTSADIGRSGNVGIGTTSPWAKLEVQGTTKLTASDGGAHTWFPYSDGEVYITGDEDGTGTGDINFRSFSDANYRQWMIVKGGTGKVGIGTTSPSAQFHTTGTVRFQNYPSGANGAIIRTDASGNLATTDFTGSTSDILLGNNSFGSVAAAGGVISSCGTANYVPKMVSSTELDCSQIFDNGTNVGIGTTSPSYKLHTMGDIYANGGWLRVSDNGGLLFQSHGGGWYMTDATWIRSYGNKNIYHNTGIMRTDGTFQVGSSGSTLNVPSGGNFAYRTSVLFANTSGNVGIGTTSPSEKLDVSGNIKASGIAYWGSAGVRTETRNDAGASGAGIRSGFYQTSAPSPAANWPTGASGWWHLLDIRHTNTGNNYAMQFAGSFNDQYLYFRKTNNNAAQSWSQIYTSANGGLITCSSANYVVKSDGTNGICSQIFDNGTNVGIGTTSPGEKLDISGSTKVSGDYYLNSGHYLGIKGDYNIIIDDANPTWHSNGYGGVIEFRGDNNVNNSKLEAGGLELTRDIEVSGRYFD
ncbi:MAG: shufflon system plasmid conjugative transfer pilus tip adhesin PilV, partial [Bacteroidota bacterium]|nr:shufflon system plasmid conjugative transfer pilus tip adhesin PilV [Bacteroidota bacterium]